MRFACVQFDIAWENKPANHARIEAMLRDASPAIDPGSFVLLPELGDTGFSMNLDRIVDDRTLEWGVRIARELGIYLQVGYATREASGEAGALRPPGRNCAAIIAPDGTILGEYKKLHPFSYGKESQFYSGGDAITIAQCGDAKVCPLICYDLRFPEVWRHAAIAGAEIFTIGASWPAARQHHWRALLIARAIENQACVVAVNRVGTDPSLNYVGGSMIVSPTGEILAEAADQPCLLRSDIDLGALRSWRDRFPALRDVRRHALGTLRVSQAGSAADPSTPQRAR